MNSLSGKYKLPAFRNLTQRTATCIGFTLALAAAGIALPAQAHNGVVHKSAEEAAAHARAYPGPAPDAPDTPGFPDVKGGDFRLIDQAGQVRTSRDPGGRYQMLFFGYASCKAICSVALPRMAKAVDLLEARGHVVAPVLITVDRERDTVSALAKAAPKIHPRLVGLTGEAAALERAYKAFQVDRKLVFEHPEHGAVYSHGSYVYLLAPSGEFLTLLPPILSAERMAEVAEKYIADQPAAGSSAPH